MNGVAHTVLLAVLSAGVLSGCGGDEPPEAEPSGSPTSPGATTSPSESATPDDEPSSTVEPASGPRKTVGSLTMNFPRGYQVNAMSSTVLTASGPDGEFLGVLAVETVDQTPLGQLARDALQDPVLSAPVRHDDLVADGVPMFHVSGAVGAGRTRDVVGVEHGGYSMRMEFTTALPRPARLELIESVLASVVWA